MHPPLYLIYFRHSLMSKPRPQLCQKQPAQVLCMKMKTKYQYPVVLRGPNGPKRCWGKARHPPQRLRKGRCNQLYISIQKSPVYADKLRASQSVFHRMRVKWGRIDLKLLELGYERFPHNTTAFTGTDQQLTTIIKLVGIIMICEQADTFTSKCDWVIIYRQDERFIST